jgi:cell division protein ZapE
MTPLQRYQAQLKAGKINPDPNQAQIIHHFDKLYRELMSRQHFLAHLKHGVFRKFMLRQHPVKGIYLWGGVGRGKTFLMDLFYESLPFKQKVRLHFHRFMQHVHHELHEKQGKVNPLAIIAKEFSQHCKVLCFDEMYVSDIADAMILAELFENLFHFGVTLVTTSNLKPEDLYHNGLQRDKFLPTIDLITHHTHVVNMQGEMDHRLQFLSENNTYHYPLNADTEKKLQYYFKQLAKDGTVANKKLKIVDRMITAFLCADTIVWFTFETLCQGARSTLDYIEIARSFRTVILSGIKVMNEDSEDTARRFIALIDEFYERHVTLIISAEVDTTALYQGKRYRMEFQRTLSRLNEMQSAEYLAKPHLA